VYFLRSIIGAIKSRKMRRAGYVVCMRQVRSSHKIVVGKHEWNRHSETHALMEGRGKEVNLSLYLIT
jgi:hypothetical protein